MAAKREPTASAKWRCPSGSHERTHRPNPDDHRPCRTPNPRFGSAWPQANFVIDPVCRQNRPSTWPASLMRITSAAGERGRPGMVMISPQIATMKPAPADSRTSRNGTE